MKFSLPVRRIAYGAADFLLSPALSFRTSPFWAWQANEVTRKSLRATIKSRRRGQQSGPPRLTQSSVPNNPIFKHPT